MTKGLSAAQRTFAEAVAAGASFADASQAAGYTTSNPHSHGARIAKIPKVASAIEHARSLYKRHQEWSLEWWRKEVHEVYNEARAEGDRPQAVALLKLAGQHLGALEPRETLSEETAKLYEMLGRVVLGRSVSQELPTEDAHAQAIEDARAREGEGASDRQPTTALGRRMARVVRGPEPSEDDDNRSGEAS